MDYTLGKIVVDGWGDADQHHRGWVNVRVTLGDGRFADAGGWWKAPGAEEPWVDPEGSPRARTATGRWENQDVVDIVPYSPFSEWGDSSAGLGEDEDACGVIAEAVCSQPVVDAILAYCRGNWGPTQFEGDFLE